MKPLFSCAMAIYLRVDKTILWEKFCLNLLFLKQNKKPFAWKKNSQEFQLSFCKKPIGLDGYESICKVQRSTTKVKQKTSWVNKQIEKKTQKNYVNDKLLRNIDLDMPILDSWILKLKSG